MSFPITQVNVAANDTFQVIVDRLNQAINAISIIAVTANNLPNGSITTGNGYVNGTFGATQGAFGSMGGGTVQTPATLQFSTNAFFGNSTANVVVLPSAITWSGVVTVNASGVWSGSNASLGLSGLSVGNSTSNAQVLQAGLLVSNTLVVNSTTVWVGNSTVNASLNSSMAVVAGATLVGNANSMSVVVNSTSVATRGRVQFNPVGIITVSVSDDAGDGQVNVAIGANLASLAGITGSNTWVQYNGNGGFSSSPGLAFNYAANTLLVSNAVQVASNTLVNSTAIAITGSTTNVSVSSGQGVVFANWPQTMTALHAMYGGI